MRGLVRAAARAADDAGAGRVTVVRVRVGALSGMSEGHLRDHFAVAAAGTVLEGAVLEIAPARSGAIAIDDPAARDVMLTGLEVVDA